MANYNVGDWITTGETPDIKNIFLVQEDNGGGNLIGFNINKSFTLPKHTYFGETLQRSTTRKITLLEVLRAHSGKNKRNVPDNLLLDYQSEENLYKTMFDDWAEARDLRWKIKALKRYEYILDNNEDLVKKAFYLDEGECSSFDSKEEILEGIKSSETDWDPEDEGKSFEDAVNKHYNNFMEDWELYNNPVKQNKIINYLKTHNDKNIHVGDWVDGDFMCPFLGILQTLEGVGGFIFPEDGMSADDYYIGSDSSVFLFECVKENLNSQNRCGGDYNNDNYYGHHLNPYPSWGTQTVDDAIRRFSLGADYLYDTECWPDVDRIKQQYDRVKEALFDPNLAPYREVRGGLYSILIDIFKEYPNVDKDYKLTMEVNKPCYSISFDDGSGYFARLIFDSDIREYAIQIYHINRKGKEVSHLKRWYKPKERDEDEEFTLEDYIDFENQRAKNIIGLLKEGNFSECKNYIEYERLDSTPSSDSKLITQLPSKYLIHLYRHAGKYGEFTHNHLVRSGRYEFEISKDCLFEILMSRPDVELTKRRKFVSKTSHSRRRKRR